MRSENVVQLTRELSDEEKFQRELQRAQNPKRRGRKKTGARTAPESQGQPHTHENHGDPITLAILTIIAAAISCGAFNVLYSVLAPIYGATGGALRALVPLGLEMILGYIAHICATHNRWLVAGCAFAIVLACGWTELDAARAAPAVAARDRETALLGQALERPATETKTVSTGNEGRRASLQLQENQGKALELNAQRESYTRELTERQLHAATATTREESRLPTELALLGALGSAALMPLLAAFRKSLQK